MKIMALTGGIGSGKSTVAAILRELGAEVIDLDRLAQEVRDTLALPEVVAAFGPRILTSQGKIDPPKLAQVVFNNPPALKKLNALIFPKTDAEIERRLAEFKKSGAAAVFIEVPVFSTAPWLARVDQVWIVKTSREITLKRLAARGMSPAAALARMANQPPAEQFFKKNIVIIENDGDRRELKAKVEKLWEASHNRREG
jgi:dephospho-CoA kinase